MFSEWFELGEQPYSAQDAEWDAFVAAHPQGSVLQTTNWARLKNRFGWSSQRVWLKQDGKLVAGAHVLFRAAAFGIVKVAYIPHGPLVDWQDSEQVEVLLNQIDFAAYQRGAGLLKMEPLLWQEEMASAEWEALCQEQGCLPHADTIQPPRTLLVDLRPSEDEILAAMKQKTRYNIRLSARKGITVREGTADDIPLFNRLMHVTGQRDDFDVHEPVYYKAAYELFAPGQAAMFIAEYEERPLAAIMVFASGHRAAYLYGASSNEERQRMPTYAVQWAAIQWAKRRGCTEYDLWGVPDAPKPELEDSFTERKDGLWGVYRFKRGFGGHLKRTVGAADRVYNKYVHKLYQWRRGQL
jgi:lipid II:glycine glycyltransferase (peptidoglycan interpeptide bridge formation enzyme)